MAKSPTNRLKNFFNIDFSSGNTVKNVDKVFPTKDKIDPNNQSKLLFDKFGDKIVAREVFPSKVQELMNWWINDVHYSADSWKNRKALFKDCELMFLNSSIMARASDLVADEIVQSDSGTQPVLVEAKRKQKNFILEFFDKINLYDYIRPCGLKIAKYGNEGWILSFDEFGIDEIIPVKDIASITDRLEFSPYAVEEMLKNKNKFFNIYMQKINRIDQLVDMIKNKDNIVTVMKNKNSIHIILPSVIFSGTCDLISNFPNSFFFPFGKTTTNFSPQVGHLIFVF